MASTPLALCPNAYPPPLVNVNTLGTPAYLERGSQRQRQRQRRRVELRRRRERRRDREWCWRWGLDAGAPGPTAAGGPGETREQR